MKKRIRKGISMALVVALMVVMLPGSILTASANVEPSLNWGLTLNADNSVVSAGDTVNLTADFNLISGILSGYSASRLAVFLPVGLEYSRGVIYEGGRPSVLSISPVSTPMGTSVVVDISNMGAFPGEVQLRIEARVGNAWDGSTLVLRSRLYLQPIGSEMPSVPNEEAVVTLRSGSPIEPPIPITPNIYTVRFNLDGGIRVAGGALVQAVAGGTSAAEPFVYRENYTFLGWDTPFNYVTHDIWVRALWSNEPDTGPITVTPPDDKKVPGQFVTGHDVFTHLSHMPAVYIAEFPNYYFESVEFDGYTLVRNKDYMVTTGFVAGSTAIHLKASYMNTLPDGYHTLNVRFRDGVHSDAELRVRAYVNPFYDVNRNDWYFNGVEAMNASGLMVGVSSTQFGPQTTMTRGMVVTLLYRFAGEPGVAGFRNPFLDIAPNLYYTNAVIWAAANGIVTGYTDGRFGPNDNMTHEQFAAVLYRYQNALGSVPLDILMDREYYDFDQISSYAKSAVNKLVMQGVFRDWPTNPENHFRPHVPVGRAEVATVMQRWIESIGW